MSQGSSSSRSRGTSTPKASRSPSACSVAHEMDSSQDWSSSVPAGVLMSRARTRKVWRPRVTSARVLHAFPVPVSMRSGSPNFAVTKEGVYIRRASLEFYATYCCVRLRQQQLYAAGNRVLLNLVRFQGLGLLVLTHCDPPAPLKELGSLR
eukprot:SAG31_NODE_526_length_14475_cov_5.135197_13_plen_151_part_00